MFTIKDIDSPEVKNYFNIFGFVKISGFFKKDLSWINEEFDSIMKKKFGKTSNRSRNYFSPSFIEENEKLTNIIAMDKIQLLVNNLLGNDPIFWGSDGNIFSSSTPWHRDYLNIIKSMKILVYLEKLDSTNGALRIMSGTHFATDKYSSYLGDALTWPEPPAQGGFNEKNFFGKGHNPLISGKNISIPHTSIPTNPGDIIIFNHNAIHCTNKAIRNKFVSKIFKQMQRRMFGLHFFANPNNIEDESVRNLCKNHMSEISLQEMRDFKAQNRYGSVVMNSKSETIQQMINPLKHLTNDHCGDYDGIHTLVPQETIEHFNEIKVNPYPKQYFINT
jgi:hypothetical protein